ncbi:MAG: hypothetical protein NTY87_02555 [Planctomycetia bacterium]|nr:hypothetical protein [Planctomycetia bacterium]
MNSLIKAVWFVAALSLTTMGFGGITHPTACAQDLVGGESIAQEEVVAEGALRFTRVHVPRGMLNDIPLGSTRYVPMTLREFDQALAKWSLAKPATTVVQLPPEASVAARDQRPLAIQAVPFSVQYTATLSADGLLKGTLEFVLGPGECSLFSEMPLGSLDVRRGTVRTAAGTGEALIFAHPGGGMALATPEAGTYSCEFRLRPASQTVSPRTFFLPLLPALGSRISLGLPAGLRPVVAALASLEATAANSGQSSTEWCIDVGPVQSLRLSILSLDPEPSPLKIWTQIILSGRQATLGAVVEPATPWNTQAITLEKDAEVSINGVDVVVDSNVNPAVAPGLAVVWSVADDNRTLSVQLPTDCLGLSAKLFIRAVAPVGIREGEALPRIYAPVSLWAGGGVVVQADQSLSLSRVESKGGLIISPEQSSGWPIDSSMPLNLPVESLRGVRAARVSIEEQGPHATVHVSVEPRVVEIDVARVTTIEVSPRVVVARAACDIRVSRGEAFDLSASLTPGWVIDSVEAVSWMDQADRVDAIPQRQTAQAADALEWKVVRDPQGDRLRIGLALPVLPSSSLRLAITGHRAGVAINAPTNSAELDMLTFVGESEHSAILQLKTNPEISIEIDGAAPPTFVLTPRLERLAEEGKVRGRLRAGSQALSREIRLVRRRAPLDVRTQVRLNVRDDFLTESFTFECSPEKSEVESLVVNFSEPMDDLVEWSLLPPATGSLQARRIVELADRRLSDGNPSTEQVDSWAIEFSPPVREPITFRVARVVPLNRPTPFPLAWIDGAAQQVGSVIVRDTGRKQPTVYNHRLQELPPQPVGSDQSLFTLAEFVFTAADASARSSDGLPVAELVPGTPDAFMQSQAWVWREITSSWCHASGATEYETLFEIENRGRDAIVLSIPSGKQLQSVLLDGVRVSLPDVGADGGGGSIALPTGRRFVKLIVSSLVQQHSRTGIWGSDGPWGIDSVGAVLDVPTLDRQWRVLLPPDLDILMESSVHRAVDQERHDWTMRLFDAQFRSAQTRKQRVAVESPLNALARSSEFGRHDVKIMAGRSVGETLRQRLFIPSHGKRGGGEILLIRSQVLSAGAILAGAAALIGSLLLSRGQRGRGIVLCVVAATVALWAESPLDSLARAAWWGTLAAVWLMSSHGIFWSQRGVMGAAVMIAVGGIFSDTNCQAVAQQPVDESLRVFITPTENGATALVPEPLFRQLSRAMAASQVSAVRVIESRVVVQQLAGNRFEKNESAVAVLAPEQWRLVVDLQRERDSEIVMDQSLSGAKWIADSAKVDGAGLAVRIEEGGRIVRMNPPGSGRQRIEILMEPSIFRAAAVETRTVCIPVAASAFLEYTAAAGGEFFSAQGPLSYQQCDCEVAGSVFTRAPRTLDRNERVVYDVTRAGQVRLARSIDPQVSLVENVTSAESQNQIDWDVDRCRLEATYQLDVGESVVRSVVVRADPRLRLIEQRARSESGLQIDQIDESRYQITRRFPSRGRALIKAYFEMRGADPVGIFVVPGVWLEGVSRDSRITHLVPSQDLTVKVDLPQWVLSAVPRESDSSLETQSWRVEATTAATATPNEVSREKPVIITVKRRLQKIRGSQDLTVTFVPDHVRLELEARLNASTTALVSIPLEIPESAVIDRLRLFEDDENLPAHSETSEVDLRWSRVGPGRIVAFVQRPYAGRFRLTVDARIPQRPPMVGPLPVMRVDPEVGGPVIITWGAGNGLLAAAITAVDTNNLPSAIDESAAGRTVELLLNQPPPRYALEPSLSQVESAATALPVQQLSETEQIIAADAASLVGQKQSARVELTDTHLVIDDRGRAWGLVRFDLVADESRLHIKLPAGLRLFEVLVDGHAVSASHAGGDSLPAMPSRENVWDVRLLDISWPRSVLVMFAGQLGTRLADGGPLELTTPALVGLPCARALWTLDVPAGMSLRVAESARVVDQKRLSDERRMAMQRLDPDFDRAIAEAGPEKRARLKEVLRPRREGDIPHVPSEWEELMSFGGAAKTEAISTSIAMVADGDASGITIRAVWQQDPTVGPRGIATLTILAVGGLLWRVVRRRRTETVEAKGLYGEWVGPWSTILAGLLWLLLLSPNWPAWILLILGAGFMVARRLEPAFITALSSMPDGVQEATQIAPFSSLLSPQTSKSADNLSSHSTQTFKAS